MNRFAIALMMAAAPALVMGQGAQPQQPPATDTVTPAIPGVCAAGTKVMVIKSGFQGTEGPIGMPDGSLIFTETQANRITRIAADGTTSTFLENTNGSNGLGVGRQGPLDLGADDARPDEDRRHLSEGRGSSPRRQLRRQGVWPAERSGGLDAKALSISPSRAPMSRPARRLRRRRRCRRRSTTSLRAGRR